MSTIRWMSVFVEPPMTMVWIIVLFRLVRTLVRSWRRLLSSRRISLLRTSSRTIWLASSTRFPLSVEVWYIFVFWYLFLLISIYRRDVNVAVFSTGVLPTAPTSGVSSSPISPPPMKHSGSRSSLVSSVGDDSGLGQGSPVPPEKVAKPVSGGSGPIQVASSDGFSADQLAAIQKQVRLHSHPIFILWVTEQLFGSDESEGGSLLI